MFNRIYPLTSIGTFLISLLAISAVAQESKIPVNNPVANYDVSWTEGFNWERVVSIHDASGQNIEEKLRNAQEQLSQQGGGVVYFPEGTYHFTNHILLKKGIVIRGTNPLNSEKHNPVVPHEFPAAFTDAREPRYLLGTRFIFPVYTPTFTANGTDNETAFKGIRLENPEDADYCGVVNIDILNGHIALGTSDALQRNYASGNLTGHMLVFGNILKNTAVPALHVPASFQPGWQRWTNRNYGAITVFASRNILIANNRIPEYDDGDFMMNDFTLYPTQKDHENQTNLTTHKVLFDTQNRTGIRVNFLPMLHQLKIWTIHPELQDAVKNGTHESYVTPGTLVKGIIIRNNYVYSTGGGGIKTTGDGAWVAYNIVRTKPSVVLPTANGIYMDAHVNDVRGIEVRGWRWTVEGNDYDVHSNYTPDGIKFNDGEGIMHESWENVDVRDSKIINNRGNRYICLWRVPARGLIISGNQIRIKPNWHAVFINSQSRFSPENLIDLPCENVVIENNITEGGGIKTLGEDGTGNFIKNNRHTLINEGKIENFNNSKVEGNKNYLYISGEK
jgi:hypothetical protein